MPDLSKWWRALFRRPGDATINPNDASARMDAFLHNLRQQLRWPQRNPLLAEVGNMPSWERRQKERRARRRALILLMRLLNPEQRQEFRTLKYFHVIGGSSGGRYRIRMDVIANIDFIDIDGKVKHRLCIRPTGGIPLYDVMAAQLLYLQDPGAEKAFLEQANVCPPLPEEDLYSSRLWAT